MFADPIILCLAVLGIALVFYATLLILNEQFICSMLSACLTGSVITGAALYALTDNPELMKQIALMLLT